MRGHTSRVTRRTVGEDAAATGLDAADTPDEGASEEGLLRKRRPRPRRWNELSMAPWRQSGVRGTEHKWLYCDCKLYLLHV